MVQQNKSVEDLQHIRQIMERSTTFVSLTGWSGIVAGLIGLIAFYLATQILGSAILDFDALGNLTMNGDTIPGLIIVAASSLGLALVAAFLLTLRRARTNNQPIWNVASRKFILHLFAPLAAGGLFIIANLRLGSFEFVCPAMLLFFGVALLGSSKFVKQSMIVLASVELILGLAASFYVSLGLLFWGFGFGVAILAYGIIMYLKYER